MVHSDLPPTLSLKNATEKRGRLRSSGEELVVGRVPAKESICGKHAPLLRIVPVKGERRENISHIYERVEFVPVRGGSVQDIEADIRDDTGKSIPFTRGRVIVSLQLRRARSHYFTA